MNEKSKYGILWNKWFGKFATVVWVVGTYFGLLLGIGVVGVMSSAGMPRPDVAACSLGVILTTGLHWILFAMIEHGQLKQMNEKQ